MELLLTSGLSVNVGHSTTPLTTALEYRQLTSLRLLLRYGADPNKHVTLGNHPSDRSGKLLVTRYPLSMAIDLLPEKEYLQELLYHGADPTVSYTDTRKSSMLEITPLQHVLTSRCADAEAVFAIMRSFPFFDAHAYLPLEATFVSEQLDEEFVTSLLQMIFDMIPRNQENFFINNLTYAQKQSLTLEFESLRSLCRKCVRTNYSMYDLSLERTTPFLKILDALPLPKPLTSYITYDTA